MACEEAGLRTMPRTLYRVMSDAEYRDLRRTNRFRRGPNSFQDGKWFAESLADARAWGRQFEAFDGIPYHSIVSVRVSNSMYERQHRQIQLDGVGPAVFLSHLTLNTLKYVVEESADD